MNKRLSPFYKNIALWLLITLVMIFLFNYFNSVEHARGKATINYSKFIELVKGDKVTRVTLQGDEISGEMESRRCGSASKRLHKGADPGLAPFSGLPLAAAPTAGYIPRRTPGPMPR